jgi:hypothetical protein
MVTRPEASVRGYGRAGRLPVIDVHNPFLMRERGPRVYARPCELQPNAWQRPSSRRLCGPPPSDSKLTFGLPRDVPGSRVHDAKQRCGPRASTHPSWHAIVSCWTSLALAHRGHERRRAPRFCAFSPMPRPSSAASDRRPRVAPWKAQWRSPASWSEHRACLRGCAPPLPARTRPPACWRPCPGADRGALVPWFVSLACALSATAPVVGFRATTLVQRVARICRSRTDLQVSSVLRLYSTATCIACLSNV